MSVTETQCESRETQRVLWENKYNFQSPCRMGERCCKIEPSWNGYRNVLIPIEMKFPTKAISTSI